MPSPNGAIGSAKNSGATRTISRRIARRLFPSSSGAIVKSVIEVRGRRQPFLLIYSEIFLDQSLDMLYRSKALLVVVALIH